MPPWRGHRYRPTPHAQCTSGGPTPTTWVLRIHVLSFLTILQNSPSLPRTFPSSYFGSSSIRAAAPSYHEAVLPSFSRQSISQTSFAFYSKHSCLSIPLQGSASYHWMILRVPSLAAPRTIQALLFLTLILLERVFAQY